MNLVICLPGNNFSGRWFDSFFNFFNWCSRSGINVAISRRESCNIYYVRNLCLGCNVLLGENQKPWNGQLDYDYILWIDSDIIFTPEDFQKLYNLNVDIASGMYLMTDDSLNPQQYATVINWDEERFKKVGNFEFINKTSIKQFKEPIIVDYTGFGFILIKRGVTESLQYPIFRPLFKRINHIYDFSMEDVAFCHLIKEKGYKVWVHPEVIVGHEKRVVLT
jgi:GT2 family glycosyltransferase